MEIQGISLEAINNLPQEAIDAMAAWQVQRELDGMAARAQAVAASRTGQSIFLKELFHKANECRNPILRPVLVVGAGLLGAALAASCTRYAIGGPVLPTEGPSHAPTLEPSHTPEPPTHTPTATASVTPLPIAPDTATATQSATPGFPLDHFMAHDAQGHAIILDMKDAWGSIQNLDTDHNGKIDPAELHAAVGVMGIWQSDVARAHTQGILHPHDVTTFDKLTESLGLPHGALSIDDLRLAWLGGMDYAQVHTNLAVELPLHGAVVTLTTGEGLSEFMVHLAEQLATVGRDLVGPAGHVMTIDQIHAGLIKELALENGGNWHPGADLSKFDEIKQMCLTDRVLTGSTREAQPESAVRAQWDHGILLGGETIDAHDVRHLSNVGVIGVETRLVETSQLQDVLAELSSNHHHATVTTIADGYAVVTMEFDLSERSHAPLHATAPDTQSGSGGQLLPCGVALGSEATPVTPGAKVTPSGHGPETPVTPASPPTPHDTDTPRPPTPTETPDRTPTPTWLATATASAIATIRATLTEVFGTPTPTPSPSETPTATATLATIVRPTETNTPRPPTQTGAPSATVQLAPPSPTPGPTEIGTPTAPPTVTPRLTTPEPTFTRLPESPTPWVPPTPIPTATQAPSATP